MPDLNTRIHEHRHPHAHLDSVGVALSGLCLAHCLLLPLATLAIPALDALLPHDTGDVVHAVLLATAAPVSAFALGRGARRARTWAWLSLGAAGLGLMTLGVAGGLQRADEELATLIGVVLLAAAHLGNWFDPRGR